MTVCHQPWHTVTSLGIILGCGSLRGRGAESKWDGRGGVWLALFFEREAVAAAMDDDALSVTRRSLKG
jgi:hypothetical protein